MGEVEKDRIFNMWLSQKIKRDPEAKKTLKKISKLISDYSDATEITQQKFWSIDIGKFLRPRTIPYFVIFLITLGIGAWLFYSGRLKIENLQQWSELSLRISVPILVLGITLCVLATRWV
ncbi:MAG: hypothetical protein Q7T18_04380 [Sedimentisphaerales bacterium]|nr:hypothetical protein [Sedimentisphaerales bacterium]